MWHTQNVRFKPTALSDPHYIFIHSKYDISGTKIKKKTNVDKRDCVKFKFGSIFNYENRSFELVMTKRCALQPEAKDLLIVYTYMDTRTWILLA